jgi:hypothetical protein
MLVVDGRQRRRRQKYTEIGAFFMSSDAAKALSWAQLFRPIAATKQLAGCEKPFFRPAQSA